MAATLLIVFCAASVVRAQSLKAHISVSLNPPRVRIEAEQAGNPVHRLSFRNSYAGVVNIAGRLENLTLTDMGGAVVPVHQTAPGEYEAAHPATRFRYEVRLEPPMPLTNAAHISWLADEYGLLMLGDLLPDVRTNVRVVFTLPVNWLASSVIQPDEAGQFTVTGSDDAVFFVGQDLREQHRLISSTEFKVIVAGKWFFTEEEALDLVLSVLKQCAGVTGSGLRGRAMLVLAPFPRPVPPHRWSAETRGSTVMFLAGQVASKQEALARLSVPLAHELFHLWVPNNLDLSGQYDWFYEGFTLYQAMRISMQLGQLSFQDYLNAMGRAFDGYLSASGREKVTLLEASRQRWNDNTKLVYDKGMLVAFLYDLTLRQQTKGRRSLDNVYRELFRRYKLVRKGADGNFTVLGVLSDAISTQHIIQRYIENVDAIDLGNTIALFGLKAEQLNGRTRVVVAERLDHRQRELLKQIGYNERASSRGTTE